MTNRRQPGTQSTATGVASFYKEQVMNKNKRITKKEIQKSLGADKAIKLKSGNEHGPLGLIHQMHEVQEIQKIKKECAL